jgi:hypothetical protein
VRSALQRAPCNRQSWPCERNLLPQKSRKETTSHGATNLSFSPHPTLVGLTSCTAPPLSLSRPLSPSLALSRSLSLSLSPSLALSLSCLFVRTRGWGGAPCVAARGWRAARRGTTGSWGMGGFAHTAVLSRSPGRQAYELRTCTPSPPTHVPYFGEGHSTPVDCGAHKANCAQ